MKPYEKTLNIFKRDPETHKLIPSTYATPELEALSSAPIWTLTEKINGTSMRLLYTPWTPLSPQGFEGKLEVRGRSDNADVKADLTETMMQTPLADLRTVFDGVVSTVCFYGEGYGAGIQKGGVYRDDKGFAIFAVRVGETWLRFTDVYDITNKLGLELVPIRGSKRTLQDAYQLVEAGLMSRFGSFFAEGLVAVPDPILLDSRGKRILCKIKNKELYRE